MKEQGIIHLLLLQMLLHLSCISNHNGCTDPLASNFDPSAINDDNNCIYDTIVVSPDWTVVLSAQVNETSGLIFWNGALCTMNDDSDTRLYLLDPVTGEITGNYELTGVVNRDWEDLAQDEEFIYVGDIGNNMGNRKDLHILRIEKLSLISGNPFIDTISFTFSDQQNFVSTGANRTEFDCEAFIVSSDSIFLFTKNWLSGTTSKYTLSKLPGKYVAKKRESFNTMGQVTGATFIEKEKILALCGYTALSQPFLYIFYDYPGNAFFAGTRKRVNIALPFHQVEGVATEDGLSYYLSNEAHTFSFGGEIPQKLFLLDLGELISESVDY